MCKSSGEVCTGRCPTNENPIPWIDLKKTACVFYAAPLRNVPEVFEADREWVFQRETVLEAEDAYVNFRSQKYERAIICL